MPSLGRWSKQAEARRSGTRPNPIAQEAEAGGALSANEFQDSQGYGLCFASSLQEVPASLNDGYRVEL